MRSTIFRNPLTVITTSFAIVIFINLAIITALTARPESDEGGFANPAINLVRKGNFGTDVYEMEKSTLTRINERTYWVMPLFLLNAAAFFKVLGFSLIAMRLVSICWIVILILAWYAIVLKITHSNSTAAFCTAFLACNYVVVSAGSVGRGDAMCAALGFTALATYLWLRESRLPLAIFVSQFLIVLSGLTHFLGILSFVGLIFLIIYLDRKSITLKLIFVASIPYMIGGTLFGLWVFQDPVAFRDQFFKNAQMSGRLTGLSSPLTGILQEFTYRYPRAFGLLGNSKGYSGPIYLKSFILLGYIIGVIGIASTRSLRENRRIRAIFIVMLIYFVVMALIDGQKLAVYLIYLVPFYSIFLAIWVKKMWDSLAIPRILLLIAITGFFVLQTGGILLRARQNTYANGYYPAVEYLNETAKPEDLIMGSAELRFSLDPKLKHIADGEFGLHSDKRPKFIVFDPGVADSLKESETFHPQFFRYFPRLLKNEYKIAYQNESFIIYVLKEKVL